MRCADIMTANPLTVRDSDSIAAAAEKLIAHRQLNIPVVDADGCFAGMFGAEDLLGVVVPRVAIAGSLAANLRFVADDPRRLAERFGELKHRPVGGVADRNAVVLAPDTPQIEAFRIFCRNPAPLAVIDPQSRKLVGLVTYWDVMGAITTGA
jgi:CBS-domain-containing membrane protein